MLGQARTTQRDPPQVSDEEERLVGRTVELATQYGRYGYRRITALLRREGWEVNHKKVERIWRKEGRLEGTAEATEEGKVVAY